MGTRNLTMVINKEKTVVAQYGQWDGYPGGQGVTVLDFLKKTSLDNFKKKLEDVSFMGKKEENELQEFMKSIGCKDGWMDSDQVKKRHKRYPLLTRDNGAEVLEKIMKTKGKVFLQDESDFAKESLFCEWAYVINLDKNILEVYKGFNRKPLSKKERFYDDSYENDKAKPEYYPVKLTGTYSLDKLPGEKQFCKELDPIKEEETA